MHHILYFSPTGHSRQIADYVAVYLGTKGTTACCHSLTRVAERDALPYSLRWEGLWLVMPVYAQGVPDVITDFLKNHRFQVRFAGICCLYGGKSPGNALHMTAHILSWQGIPTAAAAEMTAPHSYHIPLCTDTNWINKAAVEQWVDTVLANIARD